MEGPLQNWRHEEDTVTIYSAAIPCCLQAQRQKRNQKMGEQPKGYTNSPCQISKFCKAGCSPFETGASRLEKAKAMKAVNNSFSSGLLNKLIQVVQKNKSIDDTIADVQKKRVSKSVLKKIRKKIASARSKQAEASSILRSADVSTLESATEAAQSAISKLIAAKSDAKKAKKLAKKK